MGLTNKGYEITSTEDYYDDMFKEISSRIPEISGQDTNPMVMMLKTCARSFNDLDRKVLEQYQALDIDTASGDSLEKIVGNINVVRKSASKSTVMMTFTGDKNTVIPPYTRIRNINKIDFITTNDSPVIINHLPVKIEAISEVAGVKSNVASNTITALVSSISGVESIINETDAFGGSEIETDARLRARFHTARDGLGKSTHPAIVGALMNLDGVLNATVIETLNEGSRKHSLQAIVEGGTKEDICRCLADVKPVGIRTLGINDFSMMIDGIRIAYMPPSGCPFGVKITGFKKGTGWKDEYEETIHQNVIKCIEDITNLDKIFTVQKISNAIYSACGANAIIEFDLTFAKDGAFFQNYGKGTVELSEIEYGTLDERYYTFELWHEA